VIRFLSDLAAVGQLLIESNEVPDPITSRISSYYLCEITSQDIRLTYQTDPLIVPKRQAKGSGLSCDFLDETLKFFKGTRDLKGEDPFWTHCFQSLEAAGELEILTAVRDFRIRLNEYEAVLASTSTTNERFYFLIRTGEPRPAPVTDKVNHRNMESLRVHSDAVTIIMTYRGVPITGTLRVMTWWRTKCSAAIATPQDVDIVKGVYCHPSRLIERVRAIDSPLVSFNKDSPTFGFEGLSQAFNFPVSQETQTQFNTGFGWIVRRGGGQSVMLAKTGPSALEVGWWPEGSIEHPILAPLDVLIHRSKKPKVLEAWKVLEELKVDSTPIYFVAWLRSKSRFALVDQWSVPADVLRRSLLKFHAEFGQDAIGEPAYDPVQWVITRENGKAPPTLHPSCFLPTFKAVVTGSAYPDQIAPYYYNNSQRWSTPYSSLWIHAYLARKFNTPMAKPYFKLNLKVIQKVYSFDQQYDTPTLEEFVDDQASRLKGNQLSAFRYGIMLALYAKIKQLYHLKVNGKFINVGDTPARFRYPQRFFRSEVSHLAKYRGLLEEKGRSHLFRLVNQYLSDHMRLIDPSTMNQAIASVSEYTGIGWEQGLAYLQELSNFSSQMQAYLDEKRSKSTDPDKSADAAQ
jgi:hypothetical protein